MSCFKMWQLNCHQIPQSATVNTWWLLPLENNCLSFPPSKSYQSSVNWLAILVNRHHRHSGKWDCWPKCSSPSYVNAPFPHTVWCTDQLSSHLTSKPDFSIFTHFGSNNYLLRGQGFLCIAGYLAAPLELYPLVICSTFLIVKTKKYLQMLLNSTQGTKLPSVENHCHNPKVTSWLNFLTSYFVLWTESLCPHPNSYVEIC